MNRFTRLVKENLVPFIIFLILLSSCCGAWFFLHPSSPYHERTRFVVSYDAVGTLSPGNRVEVRGISRGQILKVELTDDAVYVTAEVLATTKIPRNSEFRLINSGLMGEREMCILTGDSPDLVRDGDTLVGKYDEGMSGVGKKLVVIMGDMKEIKDSVRAVVDSIEKGESGKQLQRVTKKVKQVVQLTKVNVRSWKTDVDALLDECDRSLGNAKQALDVIADRGATKIHEIDSLMDRTQQLLKKVIELKGQTEGIVKKLTEKDNTASLFLAPDSDFNRELDRLVSDVDSLLQDIKKNGLDINIDIF
ncbi:MAG: MCE family protein [Fibrobacter sp.]|nr:MCE family protein [Fibrobacter sp.]